MEDQVCPRCRTTKYRNPSLKLLVNVCGHSLCESCVELLFLKGSGSCPDCQIPLRRCNFRLQLFEDPNVEKEVDVRKRILRDYNKREEDFEDLSDYNDYLESIEDIVYNLVNGIDVLETNKRIEAYKKENRESIVRNKMKKGGLETELEELIEQEKRWSEKRKLDSDVEERERKSLRSRAKEALIDELTHSAADARSIVETYAERGRQARREGVTDAGEASSPSAREALDGGGGLPPLRSRPKRDHRLSPRPLDGPPRGSAPGEDPAKARPFTAFSTGIKFATGGVLGSTEGAAAALRRTAIERESEKNQMYSYRSPERCYEGPNPQEKEDLAPSGYLVYMRTETTEETAGGFDMSLACWRAVQESIAGLYYSWKLNGVEGTTTSGVPNRQQTTDVKTNQQQFS